jgi:hypothetical protein
LIARFVAVYAAIAVIIAAALGFFGGFLWIINAISATIGSFLVAITSFAAQRKIVLEAVKNSDGVLDTIDDKEELYQEDEPIAADLKTDQARSPEAKACDENRNQATDAPRESEQDADGKIPPKIKAKYALRSFSPTRLIAYGAFVLIFFALYSIDAFAPAPFLIGLSALPISALAFAIISKEKQ